MLIFVEEGNRLAQNGRATGPDVAVLLRENDSLTDIALHCQQSNVDALLKLGDVYFNGYGGIEIDYTKAAEQVSTIMMYRVRTVYLHQLLDPKPAATVSTCSQ